MTDRLFSGLAIATLLVVGGIVSSAAHLRAAPIQPVAPSTVQTPQPIVVDESGMVALQRHAQVNMILYRGTLSAGELASVRSPIDAVALTLPAAR